MENDVLQTIVATNRWGAILPELFLGVAAVLILFVDLFLPALRRHLSAISIGVLLLAAVLVYPSLDGERTVLFGGLLVQDTLGSWMRLFFIASSVVVVHLAGEFLRRQALVHVELYHIILVVTAGFMLLVQSHHFVSLFVCLETVTIAFYVLAAYKRDSRFSLEAGLKYLVMGGLSSGILLFGITLLYGAASNPLLPGTATSPLAFADLAVFIESADEFYNNRSSWLVIFGAVLVLCGVAFKIGLVPFQIWIPDVYQGAPTPVTALLAVSSKAAGFVILYLLLDGPFASLETVTVPLLGTVAVLTLLFGNLAALGQRNVKRLIGLSGVSHAGILLMGLLASLSVDWALLAVFFYLVVYAIASLGVFGVMVHLSGQADEQQEFDDYDDLLKRNPFLGTVLLVSLGSLAGIPPLGGFVAKLLVFVAAFEAGLYIPLTAALFGVVISIYYYFGWMRAAVGHNAFLEKPISQVIEGPAFGGRVILLSLATASVVLGLYQGLFPF
jgi:NADH-quinone oxidoreductase subunit N